MHSDQAYKNLCKQVQQGDTACIASLYDMYGDALYGVILRIVKDREIANELLHDTFTKVWEKGHTYNVKAGRLYTWMMRIARNKSINYIHSKAHRISKNIQGDENLVYLNDDSKGALNIELFDLKGSISTLDSKYQEVIKLIYFKGYTQQEASDFLQIPLGTIKSRIKIALRELKKIYNYQNLGVLIPFLLTAILGI